MIDDYLKQIETLIAPNYYNKNNFKEKIRSEFEDPAEIEEKKKKLSQNLELFNKMQTEEDKKLIEEYIQKMDVKEIIGGGDSMKKITAENRMKIYQKILENEGNINSMNNIEGLNINNNESNNNNNERYSVSSKVNKTYSLSPSRRQRFSENNIDEVTMREKIHLLNIKNMNYRYEVESMKSKISELNKKIEEQQNDIAKLEKQKENNNKYLLKLENLLSVQGNERKSSFNFFNSGSIAGGNVNNVNSIGNSKSNSTKNAINLNSINNSQNQSLHKSDNLIVDFNKSNNLIIEDRTNNTFMNISDKGELKDFIANIIAENHKLKAFQSQVFEISKNYDNINENIVEGIKKIQTAMMEEGRQIDSLDSLVENMEKTLELKHAEYNFLLESKEQEVKFLQDEILKMNENVELVKRDRMRDQKVISDYETEIHHLTSRVQEMGEKHYESNVKESNNVNNNNSSNVKLEVNFN